MSNKEAFIELIDNLLNFHEFTEEEKDDHYQMAMNYYEGLKNGKSEKMPVEITENGIKILQYMQENEHKTSNLFTAKMIGEGLFVSSRSVSGSMKKLITDGFVEKLGGSPISYAITDKGREKQLVIDEK